MCVHVYVCTYCKNCELLVAKLLNYPPMLIQCSTCSIPIELTPTKNFTNRAFFMGKNNLCKFVLADWKWSLGLIPRPTWIDMGMRMWPPALWPNANSCLAPMELPQVWSQLPWVINILKKLYLQTEEKWPYYKCVVSYYTPSGKRRKKSDVELRKATKVHVYVQCFSLFSSLRGPPEVWHHSWTQLSLDIFVWPARGRYHAPAMLHCLSCPVCKPFNGSFT